MVKEEKKWEIKGKFKNRRSKYKLKEIVKILLNNRGITTKKQEKEFFNPIDPLKIPLKKIGLKNKQIDKVIRRLEKAKKNKEKIIIFGDYDADGICATAILWETLWQLKLNVLPYIPDRFEEGYGIKKESVKALKALHADLGLIITVDNGIVASDAVIAANKLGIDVIITDHHEKGKNAPKAFSIIHTADVCGAGISWFLSREIRKKIQISKSKVQNDKTIELAAIGTISDQIPLLGVNRSLVKYGLASLNKTKRLGLLSLFRKAGVEKGTIGTYEVGFIIAPRLNAMGRMEHAIESLRLLCTTNVVKATKLANLLNKTNFERQKVVDEVVTHVREHAEFLQSESILVLSGANYHEGVIGLAASKLVEEFYRPAIVISSGEEISKASARSITGFNIIDAIKNFDNLLEGGGGHPMAAGFSLKTEKLSIFKEKIEKFAKPLLTSEILSRKLKLDINLEFPDINNKLLTELEKFEPTGIGNPTPSFVTKNVEILDARTVGREGKHLKLKLTNDNKIFDAIAFGMGEFYQKLLTAKNIDVAFNLEINSWNGKRSIQLKIKDIKIN